MSNILEYKGYHTKITFDADEHTLRGKIEGIADFVNFESENITTIEAEFHKAVDDYLAFCQDIGKEPEKEYKGSFNVRIAPALHRKAAILASKNNESLNSIVEKAINEYINNQTYTKKQLQQNINSFETEFQYTPQQAKEYQSNTAPNNNVIPYNNIRELSMGRMRN